MFKNIFLKTLLNMLLLNYKVNLSRSDFFKFWAIFILFYSFYVLCGYMAFKLGIIKSIFTFQAYFIDIFILPICSIIILSLIYKLDFNKNYLFFANLFLFPLFIILFIFGVAAIVLIIMIYIIYCLIYKNSTNLQISLSINELVVRLIMLLLCVLITLIFPPNIKSIQYYYIIDCISILTAYNAVFLIPSFITILFYLIKNYKRLQ